MLLSYCFWMFRMMQNEVSLLGEILTHVGHHAASSAQSPNCQVSCRIHEALARSGHPAFQVFICTILSCAGSAGGCAEGI